MSPFRSYSQAAGRVRCHTGFTVLIARTALALARRVRFARDSSSRRRRVAGLSGGPPPERSVPRPRFEFSETRGTGESRDFSRISRPNGAEKSSFRVGYRRGTL